MMTDVREEIHEAEEMLLLELRKLRRGLRASADADLFAHPQFELTLGERIADRVAATMGS